MKTRYLALTIIAAVLSLAIVWSPFVIKARQIMGINFGGVGMERIVENFDGLNFLVVAKTWYSKTQIANNYSEILGGRDPGYYAAHYPGLPVMITFFDLFLSGTNALLASVVTSNILFAFALYVFFLALSKNPKRAFVLSLIGLFIPPRMLGVRAVGSNEPLFIFFVLTSLTMAAKKRHWMASLLGSAAILTRSPGILLFLAYFVNHYLNNRKFEIKKWIEFVPYLIMPISLLMLFGFYGYKYGSYLAYFQVGGNINLYYPFAVFGSNHDWVSGLWLEDLIYLMITLGFGISLFADKIKKAYQGFDATAIFGYIYLFFLICVAHRDLARYSLPIWPIAIASIEQYVVNKRLLFIFGVALVPILLWTWTFVLNNYQPINYWLPFL